MLTVYVPNAPDAHHLAEVVEEMRARGAPVIRAVADRGGLVALEGSHRVAAAIKLGLTPIFEVFETDDEIDCRDFDWWTENDFEARFKEIGLDPICEARDAVAMLDRFSWPAYEFEDLEMV